MRNFFKRLFNPDIEELNYTQRYNEVSLMLREIGSAMASSITDLDETLKLIANALLSLIKAQNVVIILFDEDTNEWIPHTVVGLNFDSFKTIFTKYGESLTALFLVEHPVNIGHLKEKSKLPTELMKLLNPENTLVYQLKLDDLTVGSIIVSRRTPMKFTHHDEDLLEML